MLDIEDYLAQMIHSLRQSFGERLLYVGLQGSYFRGEADAESDIDIMVVLDVLRIPDMDAYRAIIRSLGHADRACGFICGRAELAAWNPCEIWQLVHDTRDCFGTLAALVPAYTAEDIRNQVKIGIGNLYHELCHRYIHSAAPQDDEALRGAYKAVFYLLQNLYFLRTGKYVRKKRELAEHLHGIDREVLRTALELRTRPAEYDPKAFSLLFSWCQQTLVTL
ncbi:MAG: nucleotidyltransferase domain-containing protein [Acutalibacteraceae bacterium]|jgi:hypothetical protein